MRKMLVIAIREYNATVKTKAFIISIIFTPLMIGGSMIVQKMLEGQVDTKEKKFAIVDRTAKEQLYPFLEAALRQRNEHQIHDADTGKQIKPVFVLERIEPAVDTPEAIRQQRFELSERVRKKEFFGFVEVGADVAAPFRVQSTGPPVEGEKQSASKRMKAMAAQLSDRQVLRYQSDSPMADAFPRWMTAVATLAVQKERSQEVGLDFAKVQTVVMPVVMSSKSLAIRDPNTGEIVDGKDVDFITAFFVPFGIIMLMFMMVMSAAPLMQGVVEEKMQRIAEVLLGSVRPFELMMGKLLGMVGVTVTLAAVYLGAAYWAGQEFGFAEYMSPPVLAWFIVYQILAVLMYGSLFIAIGAACTETKETQTLMMPVMLLACIPLFVWFNVIKEPDSAFATGISFFPPATPMLMVARLAIPPGIPWWQPYAGVVGVLLSTLLCVYISGRIFRVGILMQGKGAKFGEMIKWAIRG